MSGYTRIPNALIEGMADLTGAEVKIALLIARDSIGWRKPSARISVATFEKRLDISRRTTLEALRGLRSKGIIEAEGKGGTVQAYSLTSAKNCTGSEVSTGAENCTDPCEKPHHPVQNLAPAYKEERNSSERNLSKKTSSSSAAVPAQPATTDDEPISPKATEAEAEPVNPEVIAAGTWWLPEQFEEARRYLSGAIALKRSKFMSAFALFDGAETLADLAEQENLPDADITAQILRGLPNFDDFRNFVNDIARRQECKPRGYGYFLGKIMDQWKAERRAKFQTELEAINERKQAEAEALQRQRDEARRHNDEAEATKREYAERRASYATMTGEQIRDEIARLKQRAGHVREYLETKLIGDTIAYLECLPLYDPFLRTPAVRRTAIRQEIDEYRGCLAMSTNPKLAAFNEQKIAELESQLAALDDSTNADGEPANIPAAPHQQTIKPAISHSHKRPVRSGGVGFAHVGSFANSTLVARRASA
jgi:phage replication O-like protein O